MKAPLIWLPGQRYRFSWDDIEEGEREHNPGRFRSLKDFQESRMRHLPEDKVFQTTPKLGPKKEESEK